VTRQRFDRLVDQTLQDFDPIQRNILQAEDAPNVDDVPIASSHPATTEDSQIYTLGDTRDRRDPRSFAVKMLQCPKIVTLVDVFDQLTMVFNAFEKRLQVDLTQPGPESTVEQFLQQLDGCKSKWFSLASQTQTERSLPRLAPSMLGYYFATHQPNVDGTFRCKSRYTTRRPPY
jgi:hypothetical protein